MTRRLGRIRDHFWKTIRMAKTLGVDLATHKAQGTLSDQDYAHVVQTCRGCDWAHGCEAWMKAQSTGRPDVPQSCANYTTWRTLRGDG